MGPKPHDTDMAPTRAGAVQDPALLPASCLCCRPSLLRALQQARAALFWTWHHGTVTSLLHTSRHVALTASQQRLCGCPCTGRAPELPAPKHRHWLATSSPCTLPLCRPSGRMAGEAGRNPDKNEPLPVPCLGPHPPACPWGIIPHGRLHELLPHQYHRLPHIAVCLVPGGQPCPTSTRHIAGNRGL